MIARWRRRHRNLLTAAWSGSALTAVFALVGLLMITGAPGSAHLALRADDYNQMTGIGSTSSAITVPWTSGLLDSSNQPLTSDTTDLSSNADRAAYAADAASATSPLKFMYSDFENLKVTVSQTQNITEQGVTVSWTGAKGSVASPSVDFMQMMECYGDATTGPSPEACEYGSVGMLGGIDTNLTSRIGDTCTSGGTPGIAPYPTGSDGVPSDGCDTDEPGTETPAHCDPSTTAITTCAADLFSIPFVPADSPTAPVYQEDDPTGHSSTLNAYFNQLNTNEVQVAYSASDGTGEKQFETLTQTESSGLGCGETESSGQTRNCWLVIVPRGSYEPNGFHSSTSVPLTTSPLSAGNWAQRIQVHLDYSPLSADCPPDVIPDMMDGTQVAYRAVSSWETSLNQQANCATVYSYTATTESATTTQLQSPGGANAGLGFTTVPIGAEAARSGQSPPTLPTILYAPVAVTALGFGFNVDQGGQLTTPIKLTPSLLARALTQDYKTDLPDYDPSVLVPGPAWVQGNPLEMTGDPAFTALNPEITPLANGAPDFPLITGDHSGVNQQIWQWVQSDAATASWLDGGTDANNALAADPAYVALNLGQSPAPDNFNEAYAGKLTCAQAVALTAGTTPTADHCNGPLDPDPVPPNVLMPQSCVLPTGDTANPASKACVTLDSQNLLPVENNFDQAAAAVLAGSDPALTRSWSGSYKAPDQSAGWWGTVGAEIPGQTFIWAVNDMSDLAAYGLISAALCDPTGANCVQPSVDSVTAALNSATPDSAGLMQVNPATVLSGGYPLTDVVYAAVPTTQSATALTDYANFISYAAGQGQTAGTAPGDLPPGYLPLPASLQAQAQSVVTQLRALASAAASATASPTDSATGTSSASTTPTSGSSQQTSTGGESTTTGAGSTTTGAGSTTTGGGSTTTGAGSTTTGGGMTTGGGSTTTAGSTTTVGGGTSTSGTSAGGGSTMSGAATATCTPAAPTSAAATTAAAATTSAAASVSATAAPSQPAAGGAAACASSSPEAFNVLPPSAEAAAGTTPATALGSIKNVLIIVLIIGAAGAVSGGLLRYGHTPRRLSRSRNRPSRT